MIPSIRELELEEEVARLKNQICYLEGREFQITPMALDMPHVKDHGTQELSPYITVKARRFHESPFDRTESFQVICKCARWPEAMMILYKADMTSYHIDAERRIFDILVRATLTSILKSPDGKV